MWDKLVAITAMACLASGAVAPCPFECHGHGECEEGAVEVCKCLDQWNRDLLCKERSCPKGVAWADFPDINGEVHKRLEPIECSGKGTCDTTTGICSCDTNFEGTACERLKCPQSAAGVCNGKGVCMSMRAMARHADGVQYQNRVTYDEWDADGLYGCWCDAGWSGHDCSESYCPHGDDPLTAGVPEVLSFRTAIDHQDEIQTISISSSDRDEKQSITISDPIASNPITGNWRLRYDTTACQLCTVKASVTTALLDNAASAAEVETALEALSNIDAVTVSRAAVGGGLEGFTWVVTFTGALVGGDVPQLQFIDVGLAGDAVTYSVTTPTSGRSITGNIVLTYDDTGSNPSTGFGSESVTIAYDASAATVVTQLLTLSAITNPDVDIIPTGLPHHIWEITFRGALGDLSAFTCDASGLTSDNGSPVTCSVGTTRNGHFIGGTFDVAFDSSVTGYTTHGPGGSREGGAYTVDDIRVAFTLSGLAWDESAANVQTLIEGNDPNGYLGPITVSRERYDPVPADWGGEYVWQITFHGQPYDIDIMTVPVGAASGLTGGSVRSVEVGDEDNPITGTETHTDGLEINAVQLMDCSCNAPTCEGSFRFRWRANNSPNGHRIGNELSDEILWSDTVADVQAKLLAMPSMKRASLTYGGTVDPVRIQLRGLGSPTAICGTGGVTTVITFTNFPGDVPMLTIDPESFNMPSTMAIRLHGPDQVGDNGAIGRAGTRDFLPCNRRGACDDRGGCSCNTGFGPSTGGGVDVPLAPGSADGCGYYDSGSLTLSSCPSGCSGHGTCSGAPTWVCTCSSGWTGTSCADRTCPTGNAWFDEAAPSGPGGPVTAHQTAECSGRGACDRSLGLCACDNGYTGTACETQLCPGRCSSQGTCVTLDQLHLHSQTSQGELLGGPAYTGWDESGFGVCVCNANIYSGPYYYDYFSYTGIACTQRTCPHGDDPATEGQSLEVQRLECDATSGWFTLNFRQLQTAQIDVTGTVYDLERELEAINTIRNVTVAVDSTTLQPGQTDLICNSGSAGPAVVYITFLTEHGDLPELTVASSALVGHTTGVVLAEQVKGTKEDFTCNRRGVCDHSTGSCSCGEHHGSSDGQGDFGATDDCGSFNMEYTTPYRWDRRSRPAAPDGTNFIPFTTTGSYPTFDFTLPTKYM